MGAGFTLVQAAQRLWADPKSRAQIVAMHAQGRPLIQMVEDLGLAQLMDDDGLRDVVTMLSDAAVSDIRAVFVIEAETAGTHGASFPVDCRVDAPRGPVSVTRVSRGTANPVVRID
ncbi:MAG: hypothetical protein ACXVJA_14445 [Acidimicrobiia bacterium]